MGKGYSKQEREETLKLAQEIGATAVSRRLGVNVDTIYTGQSMNGGGNISSVVYGEKGAVDKLELTELF